MGPPYWPRFCPMGFSNSPIAQKGGQKKSIALDQTGYGAIRRVNWGPLNRTFPAPYPPGSDLSVENPCFGPWAQVPPSGQKKKWRNGAKPKPATGMAGGDARGAMGTAGAMGPAELMTGFVAPHSTWPTQRHPQRRTLDQKKSEVKVLDPTQILACG